MRARRCASTWAWDPPGAPGDGRQRQCSDDLGRGLATRLVRAVAAGIHERGETPFLHAIATNTNAIRLYESIGFTLRRRTAFTVFQRSS